MPESNFYQTLWLFWESVKPYLLSGGALTLVAGGCAGIWKYATARPESKAKVNQIIAETEAKKAESLINVSQELIDNIGTIDKQGTIIFDLKAAALAKDTAHLADLQDKDREADKIRGELLEAMRRLADSDEMAERFCVAVRRLFMKLNIPFWETDSTGKGIYTNLAWTEMFGVTSDTKEGWIERVHESDRARIIGEFADGQNDADAATTIGFRMIDKTGAEVRMHSIYQQVRRRDGEIVKVIGVTVKQQKQGENKC